MGVTKRDMASRVLIDPDAAASEGSHACLRASKRPRSNMSLTEKGLVTAQEGPRKARKPSGHHHWPHFKNRAQHPNSHEGVAVPGVAQEKKRARAIQRLLAKQGSSGLPGNVRRDLERELDALTTNIKQRDHQKQRSKMISKYHMVRFFERRKAERLVNRLQRQVKSALDGPQAKLTLKTLETDLRVAEVDLAYTKYHPHLEPYISLYSKTDRPNSESGDRVYKAGQEDVASGQKHGSADSGKLSTAAQALHVKRPPTWKEVEQAMKDGKKALEALVERRQPPEHLNSAAEPLDGHGRKDNQTHLAAKFNKQGTYYARQRQSNMTRKVHVEHDEVSSNGGDGFFAGDEE